MTCAHFVYNCDIFSRLYSKFIFNRRGVGKFTLLCIWTQYKWSFNWPSPSYCKQASPASSKRGLSGLGWWSTVNGKLVYYLSLFSQHLFPSIFLSNYHCYPVGYMQEERRMALPKYQVHDETSQVSDHCLFI